MSPPSQFRPSTLASGSTKSASGAGRVKRCCLAAISSQARRLWDADMGQESGDRSQESGARMAAFGVDAGEDFVEDPVEDAEVDALDHAHVVERDVQAVLLHRFQLTAAVAGE